MQNRKKYEKSNKIIAFSKRLWYNKNNGTFDKESQKVALIKAKDEALSQMTDEIKDYITKNYGDLQTWLTTQIEATINILKNN